jgi:hypothetical protein
MANTRPNSSSTQTFLVAGAVVLAALGIYLNIGSDEPSGGAKGGGAASPGDAGRPTSRSRPRDDSEGVRRLRISPEKLNLGTISQCGPRGAYEIVLSNDGTVPVTVVGWVATSSGIRPGIAPNAVVAPGGLLKVPIEIDPLGLGPKSQRLDFRLDGNARGGSVRIDYEIVSPIVPMPVLVVRPEVFDTKIVDLERVVDPEREAPVGKFAVTSFEPPVARVVGSAGDGHVAIEIDFKAIDALAADNPGSPLFEWEQRRDMRRWKAFDLEIATDSEACPSLRLRVRNK